MDRKKILIVEDEPEMSSLLKTELETSNFEVFQAADGTDGLKQAMDMRPDLVILDVMLPGMGGYEVCWRLKAAQEYKDIPILMFTARCGDIDKTMGFECGTNEYLTKPFDSQTFLKKVRKLTTTTP